MSEFPRFLSIRRSTDLARSISKKFTQYAFRQVGTRKPSYMPNGPCISRLRPCESTYPDCRTKETVTCAASVLLTSKPVDVIFRPLHAAKRSRGRKPYRDLQSSLFLPFSASFSLSFARSTSRAFARSLATRV